MSINYTKEPFRIHTPHSPAGDQPAAIKQLVTGLTDGLGFQTLLGATGTGKTYTMAKVIAETNKGLRLMDLVVLLFNVLPYTAGS